MGLHNGLIAILAVRLLFLEVSRWHVNGETLGDVMLYGPPIDTSDKTRLCTKVVSYKMSQYVPYMETFRAKFNPVASRFNYKIEYHTQSKIEPACCEGYVQIGRTCAPRCPRSCKKGGTCLVPDVCTCNEGYHSTMLHHDALNVTSDVELCVPACAEGCVNGTCVEPDICSCDEGYWMDSDGRTCRPVCDDECERNGGRCVEPRVCSCRSGYAIVDNGTDSRTCEPVCERVCTNGRCTAPNVCECEKGYVVDEDDPRFSCKPECPCEFGECTKHGVCICNKGYYMTHEEACEPVCSVPCVNGTCVAPETCNCNEGYRHPNESSKHICEPICDKDCGYGECTAPGVCTCDKGFVYNRTDGICKPDCKRPCAECASVDNCSCLEAANRASYREEIQKIISLVKKISTRGLVDCLPLCKYKCIRGICTQPYMCLCEKNLTPIEDKRGTICIPQNVAPSCFLRKYGSCWENGTCGRIDDCDCKEGYVVRAGHCEPLCPRGCGGHKVCVAPNVCVCAYYGYAMRNNSSRCEPICKEGCRNGDCVAPNHCVCHEGFEHKPGRDVTRVECVPVCKRNCSGHGVCVVVDDGYRCECRLGWKGENCDQPTMCALTMDFNRSDVNRITIRDDRNDTIMRTHEDAPRCHRCDDYSLNNETLCYVVRPNIMLLDEENATVGCLLSTDLPCYMRPHYNASTNVAKVIWSFITLVTLLTSSSAILTYFVYRRHQRKKLEDNCDVLLPAAHIVTSHVVCRTHIHIRMIREKFSTSTKSDQHSFK